MTRVFLILFWVAFLISPAAAQSKFPVGQTFKVISISGFDVQKAGITFAVAAEPQSNRLVGNGNAGCNNWTATVVPREEQLDITNIVTARKMCPKPRMTTEEAFLTTLKSAQRWRIDDKRRLIVEGGRAFAVDGRRGKEASG